MKTMRLKLTSKKIIFYTFFLISLTLVSCSNLDQTTYIENSLLKADNYILDNNYDKAAEIYDLILKKDSFNQKTLYNKAVLSFYQENNEQAIELLNLIIEKYPNNIKPYQFKIKILLEEENFSSVIDTYTNLLNYNPTLYSTRADFIETLLGFNDDRYNDLIKDNALFLVGINEYVIPALKALCTIEKNNAEYSALLLLKDEQTWRSIYSPPSDN